MQLSRTGKVLISVLGALILIALIGLLNRGTDEPRPAAFADQPSSVRIETKLGFMRLYNQVHGPVDSDTTDFLLGEAELSCARLGNGYSLPEVWEVGVRDGMSSDQAATVINSAVLTFCPEMQARLSDEAGRHLEQGNTTWAPIKEHSDES